MATKQDLRSFWFGLSANYEALETKDPNAIYFLTDTKQIARGDVKYSQEAQIVSELPDTGIRGYIYFNTTDGIAYVYNGTEFKAIGVITVSDIGTAQDGDVPNVAAVKAYVGQQITAGVENKVDKVAGKQLSTEDYTTAEKTKLGTYPENYTTVTALIDAKADPSDITDALNNYYTKGEVDGMVASVFTYKGTKATESELPQSEQKVGDVWHVDEGSKEFAWDGTQWEELGGVIDLSGYYTKEETDGAIDTKVNAAKSELQTSIDTKAAKVTGATENNLAKLTATGDLADGGVKVGGANLSDSPNSTTIATELAVKTYADNAISVSAATKVDKVAGVAGNVVVFGADSAIADTGLKVNAGSNYANGSTPDAKYIVTETVLAGVVASIVAGDLGDALNNKADVVGAGKENELLSANATGNIQATGYKIGSTAFAESGNGTLLATEQAVIDLLAWKEIPTA